MSKEIRNMEERDVIKWNKRFNFCKWAFIMVAILSLVSMTYVLATGAVTVFSFTIKCLEVIIYSLTMAFLSSRTRVAESE